MLSQFQASYQRIEQSLQRLTESIASYNPSVRDAEELVAADEAVHKDLDQLVVHQTNYQRIQQLRQTTDALDESIRSTIKLIADTRREIASIPSSATTDEPRHEIKVDELLAYAKFISRTTVPPTFRKHDLPTLPPKTENGQTPVANGTAILSIETRDQSEPMKAMKEKQAAQPELPWVPWPAPEVISGGALGQIQLMVESGQDPGSVLTAEEQAERDRVKQEEEEREKVAQEEAERRRMSMFDTGAMRRRQTYEDVFDPDNE